MERMGDRMELGHTRMIAGIVFALAMAPFSPVQSQPAAPPLPPPRPDRPALPPDEPKPADKAKSADGAKTEGASSEADKAKAAEGEACRKRLTELGLKFETSPPVQEKACSVQNPVVLSELAGGVKVVPASLMTCPMAEALGHWMERNVKVQAEKAFKTVPTKLLIGTSYQCRNQTSGSKLSEHAFGNGVDVMGFEFSKRPPLAIDFQKIDSAEAAFQETVRSEACKVFTTVLGPGSDAAHGNHLHVDMRARKGDYRICQ
jgi:hypothetical protein